MQKLKTPLKTTSKGVNENMSFWKTIETAPKNGTRFLGMDMDGKGIPIETWYGKTSHVPLYGWCHGIDVEDIDLWQPTHWKHTK